MQPLMRVSPGLAMSALGCSVAARQPIIDPAKGQSPQRQQSDTADCRLWAKQTTGVDPVVLAQQASGAQVSRQLATYHRATAACMTGRRYTM
jgi:hypothetical protein